MMDFAANPGLQRVAGEARQRLEKALQTVEAVGAK